MKQLGAMLLLNGIYLGAAFLAALIVTLIGTSILLRLSNLFLRSKLLSLAENSQEAFRSRIRRLALLFMLLVTLLIIGGGALTTWLQIAIGDYLRSSIERMQAKDWLGLGIAASKAFGVLILAFIAARLIVAILHYIHERLQRAESLASHRERLDDLLERLRLAMSCTVIFGALILSGQLIGLSAGAMQVLWVGAFIFVGFYVARFAVGTAHLAIDVVFDLSEVLARLENPLRYLGRFRHLATLTKRTIDYFIYVGVATWVIDQITPGTWASQAGRLAIRIIAIFYISRVLVEVCLLFMNEFFLQRTDRQSESEYQQRQTLVPVAAGFLRYGIYFCGVVMMLREAGLDPMPLLAGAGVVGVAIGLGAQAFVGDIVAGFFILFENLLLVGDFVEVADVKGKVEEIGIRVTRIRDEAGLLHAVPNGEVRKVASHSRGYVNVVIDFPVPYGENLHRVFDILSNKTVEVRANHPAIMSITEFSLEEMRENAVLLRTVTMVKPNTDQDMANVLRLAFWEALTTAGIEAPYMRRMMVPAKQGEDLAKLKDIARGTIEAPRTDIQRLKAANLYRAFDVDNNGFLEKSDGDALAKRIILGIGRQVGSPLHTELQHRLATYWTEMVRFLDSNQDGRVSREEFLRFSRKLSTDHNGPGAQALQALGDVLFSIADHDGAGTISEKEFIGWARAYGVIESVAGAGFRLIDSDGNGRITREEWQHFTRDIFLSQKLNDATAIVFGPGCRGPE